MRPFLVFCFIYLGGLILAGCSSPATQTSQAVPPTAVVTVANAQQPAQDYENPTTIPHIVCGWTGDILADLYRSGSKYSGRHCAIQ